MTEPQPHLPPGRRLYEQVRAMRRARRRFWTSKVTRTPAKPGVVLQFPNKKEVADAHPIDEA